MTDHRSRPRWHEALRLCPAILGVLVLTLGCDRAKDAKKDAPPPPDGSPAERPRVHLLGSGTILNEALRAQEILAQRFGVAATDRG